MTQLLIGPDWSDLPHVRVFCSTRRGGESLPPFDEFNLATHVGDDANRVARNRELLRDNLEGGPQLQWLNQVHGKCVTAITDCAEPLTADGLISATSALACCVLTADCLPVVLVSESTREVAAVHAGWRGLAAGILEQALSQMATPASELRAWLGPAIGPCHFEVGDDVRQAFASAMPGSRYSSCFSATGEAGKFMADLPALARLKLEAAGLQRIESCGICSYCDAERFYSFRREAETGRNATGVYLLDHSINRA